MTEIEKLTVFVLDEMKLHQGLSLNIQKGYVEGWEDYGIEAFNQLIPM